VRGRVWVVHGRVVVGRKQVDRDDRVDLIGSVNAALADQSSEFHHIPAAHVQ